MPCLTYHVSAVLKNCLWQSQHLSVHKDDSMSRQLIGCALLSEFDYPITLLYSASDAHGGFFVCLSLCGQIHIHHRLSEDNGFRMRLFGIVSHMLHYDTPSTLEEAHCRSPFAHNWCQPRTWPMTIPSIAIILDMWHIPHILCEKYDCFKCINYLRGGYWAWWFEVIAFTSPDVLLLTTA